MSHEISTVEDMKALIRSQSELELYAQRIGLSTMSAMFMMIRMIAVCCTVVGWSVLPKILLKMGLAQKVGKILGRAAVGASTSIVGNVASTVVWASILPGLLDDLGDIQDWFKLYNQKVAFTNQERRTLLSSLNQSKSINDDEDDDYHSVATTYSNISKVFYGLYSGANSTTDEDTVDAASKLMILLGGVISQSDGFMEDDLVELRFDNRDQARVFLLVLARVDEIFEDLTIWYSVSAVIYRVLAHIRVPVVRRINGTWLVLSNTVIRGK